MEKIKMLSSNYCNMNMFNTGMYNTCNGEFNYDAYVGAQLGSIAVNTVFGFLGTILNNKGGDAAKAQEPDEIDDLNTQIETACAELGEGIDENNYSNYTIDKESQYQKAIDDATEQKDIADKTVDKLGKEIATIGDTISDLEKQLNSFNGKTSLTDGENLQYQRLTAEHDKAVKKMDDLKAKQETAQKELEAAQKALETAATAKTEREKAIAASQAEIKELIETRDEKINEIQSTNASKLANGTFLTRMGNNKYNELFDTSNNLKADAEINEAALRKANARYAKAETLEEKNKIWLQIDQLYKKLDNAGKLKNNPNLVKTYETMKKAHERAQA